MNSMEKIHELPLDEILNEIKIARELLPIYGAPMFEVLLALHRERIRRMFSALRLIEKAFDE